MRVRRTWAEVTVLHDAVLDRWAARVSGALITMALGLDAAHVSCILHEACRRGDPRAGFRHEVAGRTHRRQNDPAEGLSTYVRVTLDRRYGVTVIYLEDRR